MGTGFAKKKKQAQMMQQQFAAMQQNFKSISASGQAGNGLVSVELNGENELVRIRIEPSCVDPKDVEGLEDLIKAAYNDAKAKLAEKMPSLDSLQQTAPASGSFQSKLRI